MTLPIVAEFAIRRRAYLSPEGTNANLVAAMVLTRTFDLKAVSLQRTGRLGTYAVSLGQEGVAVGVGCAMRGDDVLLPSYRDNGALIWRGVKLDESASETGLNDRRGRSWREESQQI